MNKAKFKGAEDVCGRLDDLRVFLENYEISSYIQKLQNNLQTVGINPDDENAQEQAEKLKKIQDDLSELGIDELEVKKTIENERNKYKLQEKWVNKYLGKDV